VFPGGKERPGHDADPSPFLVPWSWKGRAIPLLLLWAVWPVQILSACTRVHFTFTFTFTLSCDIFFQIAFCKECDLLLFSLRSCSSCLGLPSSSRLF
jgi:hypothetical protein